MKKFLLVFSCITLLLNNSSLTSQAKSYRPGIIINRTDRDIEITLRKTSFCQNPLQNEEFTSYKAYQVKREYPFLIPPDATHLQMNDTPRYLLDHRYVYAIYEESIENDDGSTTSKITLTVIKNNTQSQAPTR